MAPGWCGPRLPRRELHDMTFARLQTADPALVHELRAAVPAQRRRRDRRPAYPGKPIKFASLASRTCARGPRSGRFWLKRITISKRMRAKLREINDELKRRRHQPVPVQGAWLRSL